ncbi:MAG TPA: MBL fold metallo-hydrolase, partial [Verrucomicrobiota bacterium]|nr:MBL fold metallo-hydrolase [Verrucomicrobiota bacterium]
MIKSLLLGTVGLVGIGAAYVGTTQNRRVKFLRELVYDGDRDIKFPGLKPSPSNWSNNAITLSWLSHSTVLINFFGVWILTDPVFSERIGPSLGIVQIGPKRYIQPALAINELPDIDIILLSHAHYDHTDLPSLRLKGAKYILTAKITTDILKKADISNPYELGWGEKLRLNFNVGDIEITPIEVVHWGKRWPDNTYRGYNGYIIKREGRAILFAGDTAYTSLFSTYRRYGKYDIAIMPIGAYDPWIRHHCTPEQAVQMANDAG